MHVHFILNMQVTDFKPTKLSLLTLLIASMLILMGGAAVAPALPEIGMVFPQYDSFVINLIISLPSLAIVLAGLVIGALADRLGKVRVLLVSLELFGVAGVSGYFINDIPTFLIVGFISVYGGLCDSVFVTVCALGFVMALVCGVVSMTKGRASSV